MGTSACRRIAEVRVEHGYFASGICRTMGFRPSGATANELYRRRWMLRPLEGGFSIHVLPDSVPDRLECRFVARPTDSSFGLYTDASSRSPGFVDGYCDGRLEPDGVTMVPSLVPVDGVAGGVPDWMVVDLKVDHDAAVADGTEAPRYRIRLEPRKLRWRYLLFGEFAKAEVQVIDPEDRLRFRTTPANGFPECKALVSEAEIAFQEIPTQRLQLRDFETGRVLIKRLPLPDFRKIGREVLPAGESALVAEAYINP